MPKSMRDALLKTVGLESQSWIKLPVGAWKFLRKCGYSGNEIGVVLFFYHRLCSSTDPESTIVFATSQEIMETSGASRRAYYSAIEKMVNKGMIKKGANTYDLSDYLKKMDLRGNYYTNEESAEEESEDC
jgi:hypothetical protein